MKKKLLLALGLSLGLALPAAAQDSTTGAIHGQVRDVANGNGALSGVTVIAKSSRGTQTDSTDSTGRYRITGLIPGTYTVTFYYSDKVAAVQKNVRVSINKTSPVYVKLDSSKLDGTDNTIIISGRSPTIDTKSTSLTTTLDQDYVKNMPVPGRTFEDTLGAAPGTSGDGLGVSFSGSTSLENQYNVDGVNTTSLVFGTVGTPVINDFVQEIEIITGGYNAEYGRATGGIANVVTKSGSNEFRGTVFGYISPGFLRADPQQFDNQSSPINAFSNIQYNGDFGFEVSGPIIKDKLFYFVGFAPQLSSVKVDRVIKRRTDCRLPGSTVCDLDTDMDNDGFPDASDGLPDKDENGRFILEDVDKTTQYGTSQVYNVLGKINFAATQEHQGQLSAIVSPGFGKSTGIAGLEDSLRRETEQLNVDLSLKWTSKFNNNDTEVEFVGGLHYATVEQTAANPEFNDQIAQSAIFGNLGIWSGLGGESDRVRRRCTNSMAVTDDNPYPFINVCPDEGVGYSFGGIGSLFDEEERRLSARIGLTQRLRLGAAGNHEFKAGADVELNNASSVRHLSGGESWLIDVRGQSIVSRWAALGKAFEGDRGADMNGNNVIDSLEDENGNRRWDRMCTDSGTGRIHPCDILRPGDPRAVVNGETLNWAAYLRDSWEILPNLTLNAGIRYEEQRLRFADQLQNTIDPLTGRELGKNAMTIKNMWAPRVGIIYDWTKVGRSKIFAHWGRFYESIPMDINDRSFGGETFFRETYLHTNCGAPDGDVGGPLGPTCAYTGDLPEYNDQTPNGNKLSNLRDVRGGGQMGNDPDGVPDDLAQSQIFGSGVLVAPGIKGQYMDELVIGLEYELLEDFKIGIRYQNRALGTVLEDVSIDNAETYILANPGEWSESEEQRYIDEIAGLQARIDNPGPNDDVMQLQTTVDRLENELEQFRGIRTFDTPRRDYNAFEITIQKRFSRNFFLQGNYTYSRTVGNFPGLFSPDNGQVDPNISSQFDLIELLANREGPLPQDRPHYIKIDSYYVWDFKKAGQLTTGIRFRALSGTPRDALGRHYRYGFDEAFILPRGAIGRTDFDWSLDTHIGYKYQLGRGMDLEIFADIFNVANQQGTAAVSETYTIDFANPIVGGDESDLVFLKQTDDSGAELNQAAGRFRNFQNTTGRYAPLRARLGVRLTF